MKAIYKYMIPLIDAQLIPMPKGAIILSVGNQHECVQMWAEVDVDAPKVGRRIAVIATGQHFDPLSEYPKVLIGRVDLQGGSLIFHVFDHGEETA